jgi:GAF domain-containing protein
MKRDTMSREHPSMVMLVSYLRWVIPLAIGLIGVGYILLEQMVFQGHPLFSPDVVRTAIVIGLMGPALAWLILSWAKKLAVAEADAQQELAFRNRELAALNAIGDVTSQSLNLDEILRAALEKMVELMGLQAGEMRVVEGDRLILKSHYGVSQAKIEEPAVRLGQCLCGTCAQSGKTLTMDNLPGEPSLANLPCAKEGFRSIINIPMKTKGQVLGVILLASRNQNAIAFADRQILNAIGYRVAMAIENARLYQEAHRRAIHLETASLVGQRISALLDLDSLLAEVVRLIREKFGYYHVHIFIEDEETREIVLKEASGLSADLIKARGLRLKVGQEGIIGWVAYTGQTLMSNDVNREPRYYKAELVPDTKAELAVPLRVGNRIIGVLDVQSDRINAFDKEDVTVLQILGNQIGVAIQNVKLFQQTKQRYNAMIALHETSLDVIAQLDTPKLLEALLRRGAQLLEAQAGSLFLYDAEEKSIRNIARYNTERDRTGVTVRLGEGAIGQVVLTGKPLIINDYENWEGKTAVFSGDSQRRVISVPLNWQGQVIGGLNILNQLEKRPFDRNDLWLLSQFADLASLAIKNAELHTQVKEFSQELERRVANRTEELSRARDEIATKAEQLSSLLVQTIDIQEEERARIARDMHDGVIQLISAARFELQATQVLAGPTLTAAAEEKLETTFQVLQEMEKEIRRAIYDLHPPILDAIGLAPALQKRARNFEGLSGIVCGVQVKGMPYRLPQATEIAVFRMVEEALQNVAAHANGKTASIILDYAPNTFCVSVQDDGQGFDYNSWMAGHSGNHLGLLGMQERIKNLGGKMGVTSERGHGTQVMFQLPVVQDEDVL